MYLCICSHREPLPKVPYNLFDLRHGRINVIAGLSMHVDSLEFGVLLQVDVTLLLLSKLMEKTHELAQTVEATRVSFDLLIVCGQAGQHISACAQSDQDVSRTLQSGLEKFDRRHAHID